MRLKLTLRSEGGNDRDILVTSDATSTVGDVAAALADSNRQGASGAATLWTVPANDPEARVLNPLLSLHDSGLRSGAAVALVEPRATALALDAVAATVEVLAGPDAGARFALPAGVSFIGRDDAAHVRLHDPEVSRRHGSITVGSSVVVTDLNSANGLEVDGERVERAVVTHRSRIRLGATLLRIELSPRGAKRARDTAEFSRSPRVVEPWHGSDVSAPTLPSVGEKPPLPWIAVVAPVIAGVALFALTRNPLMLLFIAISPLLMLGMWLDQRVRLRRQKRQQAERFDEGLRALERDLGGLREDERAARLAESPSTQDVVVAVAERAALLWTRMPEHAAFLSVRFGLGTLPSRTAVTMPSRDLGATAEWERLSTVVGDFAEITDVPVVERFGDAGAIGIAGADLFAYDAARALLIQIAALHSPADVALGVFADGDAATEWEWLKWLPHVDSPHSPLSTPIGHDVPTSTRLLSELEELLQRRRASPGGPGEVRSHLRSETPGAPGLWDAVEREPAVPAVVVFIAADAAVDRGRLVQVAQDGPDVGVYTIWLTTDPSQLPVVCRTYLTTAAAQGTVSFVRHGAAVPLGGLELLPRIQAVEIAKALAPLEDTGAPVLDESDLPAAVTLVELFDDEIADDPEAIVGRWRRSDSLVADWSTEPRREPGGLGALVGQGASSPLRIDLRRDGPHALVGGTTGSGKSEFLQTWILGMAVENSPDRLTFLLVDYKGGSAFGDCVTLPHTVGLVTDLTPHLVRRALTSLRAELKRRETLLAAKGAKDLLTLEERGDHEAPPSLVIVIDEFAALISEVPEFVDGVIDVAQRGRSLGLHLVMATQRPAGVIKESLRANTNLRVALRVADEADSQDVLGIDRAAHFDPSTPGRAAAKLGAGRVIDFQTAFVGGRAQRQEMTTVEVRDLPFAPAATWPKSPALTEARQRTGPRDIERLARTIGTAAGRLRLAPPRRPWLDALPETIDLAALDRTDRPMPLGLQDEPDRQQQRSFTLDWDAAGNLAVFGTGGSGKTTFLRTLAIATNQTSEPVWLYAIDSAGGALSGLRSLTNVGAVIPLSDPERIARLVSHLQEWAGERSHLFAAANASTLTEYNAQADDPLPRVVVLIDGMAAFRAEYEFRDRGRVFDTLSQLIGNGRQVGIHFVLTADRQASIPQALLASLPERVALRLASDTEYALMGVPLDAFEDAPPGRGYTRGREVQFATVGGTSSLADQTAAIEALAAQATVTAAPIRRLEEHIPWTTMHPAVNGLPTLGVADDTLEPVGIPTGLFVVTGPFQSGRSTALRTALHATRQAFPQAPAYLLGGRPGTLADATAWTDVAQDIDDAETLAQHLITGLGSGTLINPVIVIETSGDFEGTSTETTIAKLLKTARRALGARVLVETDTVTAGSAWQIFTELKSARAGIILQPEESDGAGIFRVQLPRATRTDFPPGRGFMIDAGRVRRVQVALPPDPNGL